MKFVIDTVGTVTSPNGDTFKGVILAVPEGTDEATAARMMRHAASLWSERVEIYADTSDDDCDYEPVPPTYDEALATKCAAEAANWEAMRLKGMV